MLTTKENMSAMPKNNNIIIIKKNAIFQELGFLKKKKISFFEKLEPKKLENKCIKIYSFCQLYLG
jgi:hypothetical protein